MWRGTVMSLETWDGFAAPSWGLGFACSLIWVAWCLGSGLIRVKAGWCFLTEEALDAAILWALFRTLARIPIYSVYFSYCSRWSTAAPLSPYPDPTHTVLALLIFISHALLRPLRALFSHPVSSFRTPSPFRITGQCDSSRLPAYLIILIAHPSRPQFFVTGQSSRLRFFVTERSDPFYQSAPIPSCAICGSVKRHVSPRKNYCPVSTVQPWRPGRWR